MTPPTSSINANTASTVPLPTACNTVTLAATKMICNSDVPGTTAVDAHDGRQHAHGESQPHRHDRADVELRAAEAHLQRQPVDPHVLVQLAPAGARPVSA